MRKQIHKSQLAHTQLTHTQQAHRTSALDLSDRQGNCQIAPAVNTQLRGYCCHMRITIIVCTRYEQVKAHFGHDR